MSLVRAVSERTMVAGHPLRSASNGSRDARTAGSGIRFTAKCPSWDIDGPRGLETHQAVGWFWLEGSPVGAARLAHPSQHWGPGLGAGPRSFLQGDRTRRQRRSHAC